MTLDEEIRRGHEAERLMNEPMVKGAFGAIESGLLDAMRRVPIGDHKTQHELVLSLQILDKVKGYMREAMETGKLAKVQKETMADKAKRLFRAA